MALVVNTNIAAMVTKRNLTMNTMGVNKSFERLSSGLRINRAADDAAGLSISETLRTQVRGLHMAINNAQDGMNLLQVAEGGLNVITENLQRIRELTVQAANDTNATNERNAISREVNQRILDITRIASTLKFNTIELLTGNSSDAVLQIGPNASAQTNALTVGSVLRTATASALGLDANSATAGAGGYFESGGSCRTFLTTVDNALQLLFDRRSLIGAYSNRLESVVQSLTIQKENVTASESRIRDLDVADETAALTKYQILQQAAVSVLAQSVQAPSLALNLL
ncbi:MAG: flagellin [Cyanobacteriota bacterium]